MAIRETWPEGGSRQRPIARTARINGRGQKSPAHSGVGPAPVEDSEVESVRLVTGQGKDYRPWPFAKPGQKVEVVNGPLRGLHGSMVEVKNHQHILVSVRRPLKTRKWSPYGWLQGKVKTIGHGHSRNLARRWKSST